MSWQSSIDPSVPAARYPTTASVRQNFSTIKTELQQARGLIAQNTAAIEELQANQPTTNGSGSALPTLTELRAAIAHSQFFGSAYDNYWFGIAATTTTGGVIKSVTYAPGTQEDGYEYTFRVLDALSGTIIATATATCAAGIATATVTAPVEQHQQFYVMMKAANTQNTSATEILALPARTIQHHAYGILIAWRVYWPAYQDWSSSPGLTAGYATPIDFTME